MVIRKYADVKTGEIVEFRIQTEQEKRYLERRQQIEAYKQKGKHFIACYPQELRKINHELSLIEAGAAMRLLGYLRWNKGGKLIDKDEPLEFKDLAKILGRGKTATKAILKRLVSFGLISKSREGRPNAFFINPQFFQFGGKLGSGYFTKLYSVKSRNVVSELTLQEAGMLWKVIPYFHYENYYLCENPDEANPNVISHMTREVLAGHVGHDPKTVSKLMNGLKRKGAIMMTDTRGRKRYIINPDLMYRKDYEDDYTRSVRELFKQHEAIEAIH
ncbi:hypothetical protein [Priestia megaterium]|uniref:hypothetical protein n=1 Tax=Priestia megaterium TaxID=1404 RepID=UPI001A940CC9|nr:hypothetical protein [Priestia megaterium]QSX18460.1 hypothetical protein J0P05_14345 [Priestia megaterium]